MVNENLDLATYAEELGFEQEHNRASRVGYVVAALIVSFMLFVFLAAMVYLMFFRV